MHPPLSAFKNADKCVEVIRQLEECHMSKPFGKFFGACNAYKRSLDECLTEDYLIARQKSFDESRRKQKLWEEYDKETGHAPRR